MKIAPIASFVTIALAAFSLTSASAQDARIIHVPGVEAPVYAEAEWDLPLPKADTPMYDRSFIAAHSWEIHYSAALADLWFPVGYRFEDALPAEDYIEAAPWSAPPPPS